VPHLTIIDGSLDLSLIKREFDMKKILTILALQVTLSFAALAQPGWNWPEDRAAAEEKNVLYTDAVKMGDFKGALPALNWLIMEAPDLNKSLYQNGSKIYDNLAKVEKDEAQKAVYIDSLMWMADQRMKYFGDSVNVMNRKVFKAYKYYIRDHDKSEWLLEMFDITYKISGNKVMDQNLLAYMNVIKLNKLAKKNLTDEEVIVRYVDISEVIDGKINAIEEKGGSTERLMKQKNAIDKILTEIVVIDCDFVHEKLGPKFRDTPDDIKLVKRMFSFMLTGKCTDSDLFLDISKQLYKLEPDYGVAKLIGTKCLAAGDYSCAAQYYNEALQHTDDGTKKAEIYIQMGKMEIKRNNKSAARSNFRKSLSANAANKEPWVLIGDLYYHSYEQCKKMEDMVKDRLVFILAYDMYKRGGNTSKMHNAKSQFPSKEEIFTNNYETGQSMSVSCWINESVQLQSRD
jgi:tetratricopeptide (TPR) repeat protein